MRTRNFCLAAALIAFAILVSVSLSAYHLPDLPGDSDITVDLTSKPKRHLLPFRDAAEMRAYFKRIEDSRDRTALSQANNANAAAPSTLAAESSPSGAAKSVSDQESVTNTQHAGVDEGGIVKTHGDHLVILRRGRLFTVEIGGNILAPVDQIDAYAPGVDPQNDWYDEMLVYADTIAVIGYSYGRGGTEVNLFDIDAAGDLSYRSTYHLRSNDYYSSRNYASRLIGSKLIFYTPQYLGYYGDPTDRLPAVRKWRKGASDDDFRTIIEPQQIYRAPMLEDPGYNLALHTLTTCDLAERDLGCTATGVLGAPGRVFYVSPTSVYVWTTDWNYQKNRNRSRSMLYRLPLSGEPPTALGVSGAPIDQFSFLEGSDGHLNVMVRSDGNGDQMWDAETTSGSVALFRAPIDQFSDGSEQAPSYRYRAIAKPDGYAIQNRFVGSYLIYGAGSGWGRPVDEARSGLHAVDLVTGEAFDLSLRHGVDRIEPMGGDAMVIGSLGNDLYFSPVSLSGVPTIRGSYVRKNAAQGELRSHGFFYKAMDRRSGVLGLPIAPGSRPGYRHLTEDSSSILFIKNTDLALKEVGELGSRPSLGNDRCKASCVDWYGNARPLFLRQRVFALLGYEIVEGQMTDDGIRERRRVNFFNSQRARSAD